MLEVKSRLASRSARSDLQAGLTIAEAARRAGISVHTLRYYERTGLVVNPVDRTASGRRRYRQPDLDWITVCTKLRATGMPIKIIRRYAQLVRAGHGNEQERLAVLKAHRADVTAKLAEIQQNLKLIDHKIDAYRAGLPPATPTNYGHPTANRMSVERSAMATSGATAAAKEVSKGSY